jgi:TatD DNase family protein
MSIGLFDSHCHLQHPRYDVDRGEVIKRTLAAGCGMICVGNDWQTSKKAVELASKYDAVWATVGSHPTEDDGHPIEDFRGLIKNGSKIVAVGEIGLDYYRTPEKEKRAEQREMFLRHFELAKEFSLPLVIHCRNAYDEMLDILAGLNRFDLSNRSAEHFAKCFRRCAFFHGRF